MHLPDQEFGFLVGGDARSAGGGESCGIAGRQWAVAFQGDRACGDDQVQEGGVGQFDALAGAQPGCVQGGEAVGDAGPGPSPCLARPEATGVSTPRSEESSISLCS